jgi:hypothetical protein
MLDRHIEEYSCALKKRDDVKAVRMRQLREIDEAKKREEAVGLKALN